MKGHNNTNSGIDKMNKRQILENKLRKLIREEMEESLYLIIFSHLSDISDGAPNMREHSEFIKYLLQSGSARNVLKNIKINPDTEWENFKKSRRQ